MAGFVKGLVDSVISGANNILNSDAGKVLTGGLAKKYLGMDIQVKPNDPAADAPPKKKQEDENKKKFEVPVWGWVLIGVSGIGILYLIFKPKKRRKS